MLSMKKLSKVRFDSYQYIILILEKLNREVDFDLSEQRKELKKTSDATVSN